MIYGHGDHLVGHVSHSVQTIPPFAAVGFHRRSIRPTPVSDMVDVLVASIDGKLPRSTVAVTGCEELLLSDVVRRVAKLVGKRIAVFPTPVWFIRIVPQITAWTMKVPLIAKAQAQMLAEGVSEAAPPAADLPEELGPKLSFSLERIDAALPPRGGFGIRDLRFSR